MISSSYTDCRVKREREEHNIQQYSREQLLSSWSHDTSVITSHEKEPPVPVIRRDGETGGNTMNRNGNTVKPRKTDSWL